ncbi:MAG TPA: hypothetical protein VMN58_02670 [Acidimicrobiales bacterium]|nr:hypothetical protein [Acidimicrobiales bacterium]
MAFDRGDVPDRVGPDGDGPTLTRRHLLLAGAGTLALAACGGGTTDEDTTEADAVTTTSEGEPVDAEAPEETGAEGGLILARVFLAQQPVGHEIRLPLALADAEGALLSDPPRSISVRVGPADGELGEAVTIERHDRGIPRPYFPLRTTLTATGAWRIVADAEGTLAETVVNAMPPGELPAVPRPGDPLVAIETPTRSNPRGVDPICTADPPCPLHAESLRDVIGGDRSIVLLVSTPAFCQTAICGPVLDLVVSRHEAYADRVAMIHAEVFTDTTATTYTDVVRAYGLPFEPVLFLARPDGTVVDRLDYTFDSTELEQSLRALTS